MSLEHTLSVLALIACTLMGCWLIVHFVFGV